MQSREWCNLTVDPARWDSDTLAVLNAPAYSIISAGGDVFAHAELQKIDQFFALALLRPDCRFIPWISSIVEPAARYLSHFASRLRLTVAASIIVDRYGKEYERFRQGLAVVQSGFSDAARTLPNVGIAWRVPSVAGLWPIPQIDKVLSVSAAERYLWIADNAGRIDVDRAIWGVGFKPVSSIEEQGEETIEMREIPLRRVDWVIVDTPNSAVADYYSHCAIESGTPFFCTYGNVPPERRIRLYPVTWQNERQLEQ